MDYHDLISAPSLAHGVFNRRINSQHLNLDKDDTSRFAWTIRKMAEIVSSIVRPRQMVVLLRILKAFTFCTLSIGILADLIFIFLVQTHVSHDVNTKLGGIRDVVSRLYGVLLAMLVIMMELNMEFSNIHFAGLKPFLPRGLVLFLIANVSATSPMIHNDANLVSIYDNTPIKDEVPFGAYAFQSLTSFLLCWCAGAYVVLGILCVDRFTATAFLADQDELAATVHATAKQAKPIKTTVVSNSIFGSFVKPSDSDPPNGGGGGGGGGRIQEEERFYSYNPTYRMRQQSYGQSRPKSADSFDSINKLMNMVHGYRVEPN